MKEKKMKTAEEKGRKYVPLIRLVAKDEVISKLDQIRANVSFNAEQIKLPLSPLKRLEDGKNVSILLIV